MPRTTVGPLTVDRLTWDGCVHLAENIREGDRLECEGSGHTPLEALALGLMTGPSFGVYRADGTCVGAFGCNAGLGTIWSLWGSLTWQESFIVLRSTPLWVRQLVYLAGRQRLCNYVDIRNKDALEWLRLSRCFAIDTDITQLNGQSYFYFETDGMLAHV